MLLYLLPKPQQQVSKLELEAIWRKTSKIDENRGENFVRNKVSFYFLKTIMNSGRGGSPGFSVGPRPRSNVNKSGSLHAVPPSHSMTRPGNANFVPVAPRFSQPGSSSSSYNRFQQPSATGLVDVELIPPPVAVRKQEPTSNQPLYQPGPDSPNFAGSMSCLI